MCVSVCISLGPPSAKIAVCNKTNELGWAALVPVFHIFADKKAPKGDFEHYGKPSVYQKLQTKPALLSSSTEAFIIFFFAE